MVSLIYILWWGKLLRLSLGEGDMSYTVSILYDTPVNYRMVVAMEPKTWMKIYINLKVNMSPLKHVGWKKIPSFLGAWQLFRGKLLNFKGEFLIDAWDFHRDFPLPCPSFPDVPSFQGVFHRIGTWPAKLWSLASGLRHKAARMDGQHSSLEMLQFLLSFGIEVVIEKRCCLRPLRVFLVRTLASARVLSVVELT